MKKLLLLIVIVLGLSSCEGPEGPPGNYMNAFNKKASEIKWDLIGEPGEAGSFYYAVINDNRISDDVYDYGTCLIYQYQVLDGTEVQTALPYVFLDDDGKRQWTETLTYDFTPGSIAFYMTYSDFRTDLRSPAKRDYRIVLMW